MAASTDTRPPVPWGAALRPLTAAGLTWVWPLAAGALSNPMRMVRLAATGGSSGIIQLIILHLLEGAGWDSQLANASGFAISAQLNFLLSQRFIWGDRQQVNGGLWSVAHRWAKFHTSIAGTALLNV